MATPIFSDKSSVHKETTDSSDTFGSPGSPPSSPSESRLSENDEEVPRGSKLVSTRRKHTLDQKQSMRRDRKKRKRQVRAAIKKAKELHKQNAAAGPSHDVVLYRQMARHYWDRWQWELQKSKEAVRANTEQVQTVGLHEIEPAFLMNPNKNGEPTEVYLGQGSFSIVKLKIYRGVKVAVKQYRGRTQKADVLNEARVLSGLCHPNLPYFFGMCTQSLPYRLVMQFHGIDLQTVTLSKEMFEKKVIVGPASWFIACSQIMEAICYLHEDVHILHNDIKPDNVLVSVDPNSPNSGYQVILTDFGKSTTISQGRLYHLSESEKKQYLRRYPHIAPEVVQGETKQTTASDIFAVGVLFNKLNDHDCFFSLSSSLKNDFILLSTKCTACNYRSRPSSKQCMEAIKHLMQL